MTGPSRYSVRLGRTRRLALYAVGAGVWLSGGLWLLFHYFFPQQSDFGPSIHPLEPWCLRFHGAFSFATIWMFGLLWGVHVTRAWPLSQRRWSGGVMTGVMVWLTLSGYLLYYTGSETARSILAILHWVIGLGCPAAFLWHRFKFRERPANRARSGVGSTSSQRGGRAAVHPTAEGDPRRVDRENSKSWQWRGRAFVRAAGRPPWRDLNPGNMSVSDVPFWNLALNYVSTSYPCPHLGCHLHRVCRIETRAKARDFANTPSRLEEQNA